ncbi:hypothetical protein WJX74_002693 [Apatococcus lobatus]|uniref:Uncharacterized protein n=1 Tax=Apatococcus lobatus TaxID=904363 RepID=A0AAW1RXS4_9CHLO
MSHRRPDRQGGDGSISSGRQDGNADNPPAGHRKMMHASMSSRHCTSASVSPQVLTSPRMTLPGLTGQWRRSSQAMTSTCSCCTATQGVLIDQGHGCGADCSTSNIYLHKTAAPASDLLA